MAHKHTCRCKIWGNFRSKLSDLGTDYQLNVSAYILVSVPVEARLFEDKPVLPPLLGEVAFSVLLLPQPALAVAMAQVLA